MKLRDYQDRAVADVFEQFKAVRSSLIVMPTGTGKTVVFSSIIDQAIRERGGRAIVIAHREELIWQAVDKITRVTGIVPAVEMANYHADAGMYERAQIVVSTVQTLNAGRNGGRMRKFDPNDFSLVVLDECHHATAATWVRVIEYFSVNPNLKILGVTATPDRADEVALGKVFQSVAFNYKLIDAISDGWLVMPRQRFVNVDGIDLSSVRTTGGDLNPVELAEIMEREGPLHEIAFPTIELIEDRKTLVFAASVLHAESLCEIFNRHRPRSAAWLCGMTPKEDRRAMLAAYAHGQIQIMVNVGVLCEGFDDPSVEVIVMGRPTKSRCLYSQMAGRSTRPLPGVVDPYEYADDRRIAIAESEKPWAEIIDFVGNSGKHKLITTADILGGNYDDEVIAHAAARAKEAGKSVDMLDALKESLAEVHAQKEAAKAAEAARRARLRVAANYSTQAVDPFDVFQIEPHREMGWDTGKPITEKMRNLLDKQGIDTSEMHYSQAKQLLNELFRRWDAKEASFKQAKLLRRYGLPGDVGRDQAKEWIDKIAGNNWKLPPDIAPQRPASTIRPAPVEIF